MTTPPRSGDYERYERIERIATGGMGEVWRARDTVLGREVAVKILKQEYADDATFRARFEAEARNAARLHHPNIASVFDYGIFEATGTPFLVMELVDGKPLSELLAVGERLDPEQVRNLVAQTAEALGVAHEAGLVHRDVKPANLMVTPQGQVKVTDFGIAHAAGSAAITRTGEIVGTPHYLSPEQAEGRPATPASDVYALGVLLYECLQGRRPFTEGSAMSIALAHLRQEPPPLDDSVPEDLAEITRRAMAKDPAERYANGSELAAALRSGGPGVAPATAIAAPVAGAAATRVMAADPPATATRVAAAPPAREDDESRSRRSWWPWALLALAVLVAVILLLTRPWEDDTPTQQQPDPTPTPTAEATTPEPEPEPTETQPEEEPEQVEVVASDYIGRSVSIVETELRAKGLKTKTETRDNPGDEEQDTVADLAPTGQVDPGTTITLQVWGEPPPVELPGNGNDNSGPGSGGNNGNGNSGQGSGDGDGEGD